VIENVEKLRQELDSRTFSDSESSCHAKIVVVVSETCDNVTAETGSAIVVRNAVTIRIARRLSVDGAAWSESRNRAELPPVQNALRNTGEARKNRLGCPTEHESVALIRDGQGPFVVGVVTVLHASRGRHDQSIRTIVDRLRKRVRQHELVAAA